MKNSLVRFAFCVVLFACLMARADLVHLIQQTSLAGAVSTLSDDARSTGSTYTTVVAPARSGYIFTHWSISTTQDFTNRDLLGRALDSVSFVLYEETVLTANYRRTAEDADHDGVADGYELYWFGTLEHDGEYDGDGDGLTFAEELAQGTNPHFADDCQSGLIVCRDGELLQYNPYAMHEYVVRSEPEGRLFATKRDIVAFGSAIPVPALGSGAYWTVNGVPQRDTLGRALDNLSLTMPKGPLEVVAHTAATTEDRNKLYWYGSLEVSMDSDTDKDGLTFAEELANGTNPLFADDCQSGLIVVRDGELLQYNPNAMYDYVIRSEPEGALFATRSDTVRVGTALQTPSLGAGAYWTVNGVPRRDRLGRALDVVSLPMPNGPLEIVAHTATTTEDRNKLYWYGSLEVSMDSDTDKDGLTFAEELANGTNPLFADDCQSGLIVVRDGKTHEVNLQPYEKIGGAVVDERYETWGDFGADVKPVVADVNGDGLWDLVVCTATATNVYVNVGSKGSPEFEKVEKVGGGGQWIDSSLLEMNSTAKLATMELDVQPVGALSATTWGETLLVSDTEGRIWYYTPLSTASLHLNHKVWGGSFAGFAEGLQLAAVDWEDDGDLDCLCGTADGKLMLLRDPKVGRPTNLQALAGVDNVLLTWDPNAQSRIRGYRVYRSSGPSSSSGSSFSRIAEPVLPAHRDYPGTIQAYDYRVSSVSRFYTAGNSTPTVSESPATEAVHVELGRVSLHWTDASATIGGQVSVMLSVDNSANLSPEMTITLDYDRSKLALLKTVPSALFEGGKIVPGAGRLYEYVFDVVAAEPGETEVRVASAAMKGAGGAAIAPILPERGAVVTIAAASSRPPYRPGDLTGDGVVDEADIRLLGKLKEGTGRTRTAQQLKAGDFNGNGRLDNADYQALRALMKEGKRDL